MHLRVTCASDDDPLVTIRQDAGREVILQYVLKRHRSFKKRICRQAAGFWLGEARGSVPIYLIRCLTVTKLWSCMSQHQSPRTDLTAWRLVGGWYSGWHTSRGDQSDVSRTTRHRLRELEPGRASAPSFPPLLEVTPAGGRSGLRSTSINFAESFVVIGCEISLKDNRV